MVAAMVDPRVSQAAKPGDLAAMAGSAPSQSPRYIRHCPRHHDTGIITTGVRTLVAKMARLVEKGDAGAPAAPSPPPPRPPRLSRPPRLPRHRLVLMLALPLIPLDPLPTWATVRLHLRLDPRRQEQPPLYLHLPLFARKPPLRRALRLVHCPQRYLPRALWISTRSP